MHSSFKAHELRAAFGTFATGVTVISGHRPDGTPIGITANSFTSVSLDPPLIAWCIARSSSCLPAFELEAKFAITVLAEQFQSVALHFASRVIDKFAENRASHGSSGPVIEGGICRLECQVEASHSAGDHVLIIGRVLAIARKAGDPLLFHQGRFARLMPERGAADLDIWAAFGESWT